MDVKCFLKWAAIFAIFVVGILYVASALLISERISTLFNFSASSQPTIRVEVSGVPEASGHSLPESEAGNSRVKAEQRTAKPTVRIDRPSRFSASAFLSMFIRIAVFLSLLATPVAIFYVFLFRPLRNIPLVIPEVIQALDAESIERRKEAAVVIGEAMMESLNCPEEDLQALRKAITRPSELVETVKNLLSVRETKAKRKAVEIATMAGLTMAASSSTIGDGLGMFFWKSKLVYETFRIYGFRPDARTTVSIWAHVVFASLLAASVEELCELFDVSELLGGIGTRVVQGTVGAAVVLKGGQLARAYLTDGISSESRHHALAEFRKSAKDDLGSVVSAVGESLSKIGMQGLSSWRA